MPFDEPAQIRPDQVYVPMSFDEPLQSDKFHVGQHDNLPRYDEELYVNQQMHVDGSSIVDGSSSRPDINPAAQLKEGLEHTLPRRSKADIDTIQVDILTEPMTSYDADRLITDIRAVNNCYSTCGHSSPREGGNAESKQEEVVVLTKPRLQDNPGEGGQGSGGGCAAPTDSTQEAFEIQQLNELNDVAGVKRASEEAEAEGGPDRKFAKFDDGACLRECEREIASRANFWRALAAVREYIHREYIHAYFILHAPSFFLTQ